MPSLSPVRRGRAQLARSLADAFWSCVGELSELWPWDAAGECWPWLGPRDQAGYGILRWHGRALRATRVSWSLAHGQPWPAGMVACHACDNPPCVRPDHLWPGLSHENALDRTRKRRHWLHPGAPRFAERLAELLAGRAASAAEAAAAIAEQADWALARAAWAVSDDRLKSDEWDGRHAAVAAQAQPEITEALLLAETARQAAAHACRTRAAATCCSAAEHGLAIVGAYPPPAPMPTPWAEMYRFSWRDACACASTLDASCVYE